VRIGLSTTSIEPSRNGGLVDGIGHYTQDLRNGLEARGHTVTGYSFPALRPKAPLTEGKSMPAAFSVSAALAIAAGGRIGRYAPDCDVFHSTDFKVMPMRVPVVATVWDAIPLLHPEWLSKRSAQFAPTVLKRLVPFADRVIVATEHAGDDIARHFAIPRQRISVVNWGIDESWLNPVPLAVVEQTLSRYGLEAGYLLTVGTVQPRKNIEGLLDAYALLTSEQQRSHRLVVAGRLGWSSPELVARLEKMEAQGALSWLRNGVTDGEMRALYAAAHVFVLPSLYEGFGIPLLEAFASNVPVVTSNLTSLPEVSGGAALEVDPRQPAVMADAIRALLDDAGLRSEHIRRGRERATTLTQSKAIAATVAVYQQALAEGKRR
jgi:glycosyltransferase involved in cell wall biosynthesis